MRRIRVWRDLPDELRIPFDYVWQKLNEVLRLVRDQQASPFPFTDDDKKLLRDSVQQVRQVFDRFGEDTDEI